MRRHCTQSSQTSALGAKPKPVALNRSKCRCRCRQALRAHATQTAQARPACAQPAVRCHNSVVGLRLRSSRQPWLSRRWTVLHGEEDIERMMYNMKIDDATKEERSLCSSLTHVRRIFLPVAIRFLVVGYSSSFLRHVLPWSHDGRRSIQCDYNPHRAPCIATGARTMQPVAQIALPLDSHLVRARRA
jgi:hypothetical protein